jgi:putative ABC transport system permease protein
MASPAADRLTGVARDLVHAVRSLARARAFTSVCVLTLGIGMTPVIAIHFGMRVFTTPPPGVDTKAPTELVELVTTRVGRQGATDKWSYPDFVAIRNANTGVSIAGWTRGESEVTLPASGVKTTVQTMFVSSEYFRTIGVALARGPGFQQTADPVVILAHAFWQNRLASDPDIVGKTIVLGRVPHVVAGIAAERFGGHLAFEDVGAELFLPLERHPTVLNRPNARFDRSKMWVRIHGRLSSGVSITQASAALSALTAQMARDHPATNEFIAGVVAPYHTIGKVDGSNLRVVITLWHAMTVLPLLVVCLNVAGMVQVRSAMRERELSIRQAMGASRGRLMQYLLAEPFVLAALGCSLATILLLNASPVVSWWFGEPLPAQIQEVLQLDLYMLVVCAGLCLATSLVFGWLPAVRFSRPVIMTVLKDDAGSGGVRAGRFHRVTAALQVAIAVPLLILSFVSLERFRATAAADLGFAWDLLYAAPLELEAGAGETAESQIRRVRDNLARAGGVAAVTVADGLPLDSRHRIATVSTQPDSRVAVKPVNVHVTRVGESYLDTMAIALVRGRGFTIEDAAGTPMVTIVSRALAEKLFSDVDVVGERLTFGVSGDVNRTPQTLTIVGVTADFPTSGIRTDREQLLLPLAQHPDVRRDSVPVFDDAGGKTTLMLIARGAIGEPPAKLTAALERTLRDLDPEFDRRDIVTGDWLRRGSVADFLNQFAFAGISGGVTLLLAALGIYGVVGLMVATRTREIAVRVALGASRPRVIAMILFDVLKLVAPGVAVGLVVTAVIVRQGGGITVSAVEPLAYVAGAAIAMLTAVAASLAPARRAASVQPIAAMRST